MENCKNKKQIIDFYNKEYPKQYFRQWLELSLRKLGDNAHCKQQLTSEQKKSLEDLLIIKSISKSDFLKGLNIHSYDQINYVGW